jgi:uncharacterized protein YecT (DUF1311 family)
MDAMRTFCLAILLVLAACEKSAAAKQREAESCWLKYGSGRMDTCLTSEYGWDSTAAFVAKVRRQNAGQ